MKGKKTGGRVKGTPNINTPEVGGWCRKLVSDAKYRANLTKRLHAGELAPGIEVMLWAYAYGKPTETHEHSGPNGGAIPVATTVVHEYHP